MTPQEVIKTFMAKLANHDLTYSSSIGKDMLTAAVKASSRFSDIQNVIDSMKADQVAAEREAVEEILGSEYAGKTMSEVGSSILNASAKNYDSTKISNAYGSSDQRGTVKSVIQERKAYIFLEKYCGIQLPTKFWFMSDTNYTAWSGASGMTGNVDTGAITGSDANITLTAGDVIYGTTLTSADLQNFAKQDGMSLSGGKLIIGTGTEKTASNVVPEVGNMYTASTTTAQNISTGSNDWIVVATAANDTITTGGADSVNAGAGNDKITIGADYASIITGAGKDSVTVSAEVNNVTLNDLDANDVLTISGTFSVGSAQVADSLLVIKDKTGTRQIRLDNYEDAANTKVNGKTLTTWLKSAGFNISSLETVSSANVASDLSSDMALFTEGGGRIDVDEEYSPQQYFDAATAGETQKLSATSASGNINLDEVTITGGAVTAGSTTVGTISNEFPNVSSFTKNGLTINLLGVTSDTKGGTGNIKTKTLDELTDDQRTIVAGLFKWWAKEVIKLNEESYGIGFNSDTATVKNIGLYFYDSKGSGNTLAMVYNWFSGGKTVQLMLTVNMNYYGGISEDNVDGEGDKTNSLLDRTLSHEFTHAIMGANISYYTYLPQFIREGMAELTHGIDDERGHTIFNLAYDASTLSKALSLTDTGTGTTSTYAGGYMLLRYLAKQASLQLLVDYANTDSGETWEISGTTATYKVNGTVVATIKGLRSGLVAKGTLIDGISVQNGVITLSQKVLGTSKVTLTSNDYTLALDEELAANQITASNENWTVKNGTATLKGDLSAGYALSTDGKTVTYTAAKTNQTLATVSGLAKTGVTSDDFSTNSNVITLKNSMLGTSKVTLKGDDYTLALASDVNTTTQSAPYWAVSGTTATYKQDTPATFALATDKKSVAYTKPTTTTLATISGLAKSLPVVNGSIDGITVNGDTITLSQKVLGTSKVSVKGGNYTLALASDVTEPTQQSPYWTYSGTTATYKVDTSEGFTLATDSKSANYAKQATTTLATVSGLAKNLPVVDGSIDGITLSGDTITLSQKVLGTSKVSVKGGNYTLALASDVTAPTQQSPYWTYSGTTATYKVDTSEGFTLATDSKSANYAKQATTTLATVSGLAKNLPVVDGSIDGITLSGDTITLSQKVLGTSKVSVKGGNYTLALASDVTTPTQQSPYWTYSGTTATYKQDTPASFTLSNDKKSVTYTKPTTTTLATVSGLAKNLPVVDGSIDGITLSGDTITLSQKVLGTSKVSVKGGNYTLALASDGTAPTQQSPYWTVSGTTATYKADTSEGFTLATDGKSANYTKPTATTLATISGLAKNLPVVDGSIDGITLSGDTITLSQKVLGTSKVSVKGGNYTLALASDVTAPTQQSPYWTVSGTTATYKVDTAPGFTLAADKKSAAYTKPTATTLATVSGLAKNLPVVDGSIDGITISGDTVTLSQKVLGTSKVSVKGGNYTLALASDVTAPTQQSPYWTLSGTTATYKADTSEGFTLAADKKSANYTKQTTSTLATVTGLKKGLTLSDGSIDGIMVSGNTITLDAKVLGTTNVTVKGGNYTLAIADNLMTPTTEERWQINKTTATFDNIQGAYYAPSANNKTLTYKKETTLNTWVSVKGLASGAKVNEDGTVDGITLNDDKTVTLAGDEFFGNKVEVKLADGYTLDNQLTTPVTSTAYWTIKNGTATLKQDMTEGYTLTTNASTGVQTLTYSAAKTGNKAVTLATVTGLNKGLTDNNGSLAGLNFDLATKTIMLDKRVLGTSNITVKGDFTLNPVTSGTYAIPTATKTDTIWGVSGTKATYKTVDIGYFTENGNKALKYNAEKVHTTHATVSGVKSDTSPDNFSVSGDVITLAAGALPDSPNESTKITLGSKDLYTLKLGGDIANVTYNSPTWSYSNGQAIYASAVRSAGYSTSTDGKTVTYIPATDKKKKAVATTLATLTGVKSADGLFVGNGLITLSEAALDEKKVTLGKNDEYSLAINSNVATPALTKIAWSTGSTTTNLIGTVSAGYTVTNDKTVTYSKSKNSTLATVKGLANDSTTLNAVGTSDKTITLSGSKLSKKVEIGGDYAFTFTADYNDAAVVAGDVDDTLTFEGSGISVTGGKGDDYIDFATGGAGNVFLYATGDGDDVIADFTATKDKVKVTRGKSISVKSDGSDVLVTVDTGTIKLLGAAGQNISVIDKSGVEREFPTKAAADLLDSDNFLTAEAQLDTITDKSSALADLNVTNDLTSSDLTKLTKQSNLITYANEK